jgi:hypothetical protein
MKNLGSKIVLLLFFCFFVVSLPRPVNAASSKVDISISEFGKARDRAGEGSINAEFSGGRFFDNIIYKAVVDLSGIGNHEVTTAMDIQGSAVGQVSSAIASIYTNPPANLATWVVDTGHSLGFLPQAYAQGVGFVGLQPLLNLWKAFRNISYILLALAMIVVGFMIMFRRKIDPQTVVTVQNALPRIITTLILITFSYAIAGLMIDLMYVVMFALLKILQTATPGLTAAQIANFAQGTGDATKGLTKDGITVPIIGTILNDGQLPGALNIFGRVMSPLRYFGFGSAPLAGGAAVAGGTIGAAALGIGAVPGAILGWILGSIVSSLLPTLTGSAGAGGIFSPILLLLFSIALLFCFANIFFNLINAYIQILIGVITAPIQILMDVIPGGNGFLSWFMNMVSNLSTFVIIAVMLVLVGIISENVGTQGLWIPPIIGEQNGDILRALIGVGGMLMIPGVVKRIKGAFKAPSPFPVAGGVSGGLGGPLSTGLQLVSLFGAVRTMRPGPKTLVDPKSATSSGASHTKNH